MLADALQDGPPLLVGAPVASVYASGLLSNAAILVQKGRWSVVSRKVYQTYGQDSEARFFDRGVSCGILALDGWRLGVVLCQESATEDGAFWKTQYASGHNPLMELVQRGVDAIVHMAAVPFSKGVQRLSEQMLSHVAARHHVHLFSVNMVGGNDSRVYNGQSLAFDPTGQILARGKAFAEDVLLVDTAGSGGIVHPRPACLPEAIWDALTLGVRDFVHKCGLEKAIVALSGGMDSALVACIAVEALGPEHVLGVLMPSRWSSDHSENDAETLAKNLGIKALTARITPVMDAFEQVLSPLFADLPAVENDLTADNVQPRIRGTLLMAFANRMGRAVLGTGNKSENAVGYCTLYGDTVGALEPIGDIYKTDVYKVARFYNDMRGTEIIPENVFTKAPSAELHADQVDEDNLPPYEVLDAVLRELLENAGNPETLVVPGVSDDVVRSVVHKVAMAEFKRHQSAPTLKLSSCTLGVDWHMPATARGLNA